MSYRILICLPAIMSSADLFFAANYHGTDRYLAHFRCQRRLTQREGHPVLIALVHRTTCSPAYPAEYGRLQEMNRQPRGAHNERAMLAQVKWENN